MAFSSFFMLLKTVLSVERSVLTCSTRLLNSETTLTESLAVVVVASVVDGAAATGAGATGAGATTGAATGADVVVLDEAEAVLRPFLAADEAEAAVADIFISVAEELFRGNKRGYA
jgi:hypothetical protein